jgi:glycosyltransferase involved in cell wall biosynthesis
MKILFFSDGFRKGGKERRLLELLKVIEREKIDYRVVSIHPEIEYEISDEIKSKIIRLVKKRKKDINPFIEFYKICKNYNPDIIHTWSSMVTFYCIPTKILLRKRLINSQITDAPPRFNKWSIFGLTCRINFFFSDLILSNSYAGLKAYNASCKKSKVIHNGIDLARFNILETKEDIKRKLCISTKYCITMVASFSDNKDYETYIQVAYELQKMRNDIIFFAVGDGKNFQSCNNYAFGLGIENFHFLGKRNDVEKILKASDVGVLISNVDLHGEGISNAILEYMAMCLPVIANDAGGTREIINNGVNGYLINEESPIEIANLINDIIDDPEKRIRMGKAGEKKIYDSFTIENMGKEFGKIYYELS